MEKWIWQNERMGVFWDYRKKLMTVWINNSLFIACAGSFRLGGNIWYSFPMALIKYIPKNAKK